MGTRRHDTGDVNGRPHSIGRCALALDAGQFELARTSAREGAEQLRASGVRSNLAGWALALAASSGVAAGKLEDAFRDAREALSESRCGPAMLFGAHLAAAEAAERDNRPKDAAKIVGAVQGAQSAGCWEPPATFRFHNTVMARMLERLEGSLPGETLEAALAEGRKRTFEKRSRPRFKCSNKLFECCWWLVRQTTILGAKGAYSS